MQRNTTTTASQLQLGDRFYVATDRKKEVKEIVEHKTKVTHFQTYKFWYKTDTDKRPVAIKGDTQVIFLRHAAPAIQS